MERKVLHWSYHNFRELPQELKEYSDEVEDLYLKENFITDFPKWFFEIRFLKFLQISGNLIEKLPNEITLLSNLDFLDVSKNVIKQLPSCFGELQNLERLYISENQLEYLPEDIGQLSKLRVLECCKNKITYIPISLANCTALEELNFNDNESLYEVPDRILTLPRLEYIYVDRCNLYYLPTTLNTFSLKHVRMFENENLTHYPLVYEQYIPPMLHFTSPQKVLFHTQQGIPQLLIPKENYVLNLPRSISNFRSCTSRNPPSLVELALHIAFNVVNSNQQSSHHLKKIMPDTLYNRLMMGPSGVCGNAACHRAIFKESCFVVLRRFKSNQQYLFTQMFCGKDCTQAWTLHNIENYKCIWWS
uniref:CSON000615 protein n=1 Tax=Culicoides sonorensis TaxID=179676 RepID=A0A336MET9_CULSO